MEEKKLGKYKIVYRLGGGGLSDVYQAIGSSGEPVAIKVLHRELFSNIRARGGFLQEAEILEKLEHPNIIKILDCGLSRGRCYLVMEYIKGMSLENLIKQEGKLEENKALHLLYQISSALEYIHRFSIIHRDIKPRNILMDKEKIPKIADFGIALSKEEKRKNLTVLRAGTPAYMSPEQIRGERIEEKTDIYSLGVTAYEILTGLLPFQGTTISSMKIKHMNFSPLPPSKLNPGISSVLEEIVLTMLKKDPAERYTANSLREAFFSLLPDRNAENDA